MLDFLPLPDQKNYFSMNSGFVIANGEQKNIPSPCTLKEFLVSLSLPPQCVVVELNGDAVAPSEFEGKSLQDGDRLEIVRIVAGG